MSTASADPPGGPPGAAGPAVGDVLVVDVGPVAHGGHCVARRDGDGLVLFVRHTLPGERVRARVTELGPGGRFVRADAVEVLVPSPDRVVPPCPFSGPGRCGGCDWQHVALEAQHDLKAAVVAEQLVRLGGLTPEAVSALGLTCEPVPGDVDGLRWRTRVEVSVAVGADGRRVSGLRRHRSHEVLPVDDCRIATPGVLATGAFDGPGPHDAAVALDAVAPSVGDPVVVPLVLAAPPRPRRGPRPRGRAATRRGAGERHTPVPAGEVPEVTERVGPHEFTLSARGFWQVHPGSAATFTEQVLAWLDPRPGERALDLYSGVGLFAVPLAEAVGPGGSVLAVEADRTATRSARRNLEGRPWADAVAEPVESALARLVAADDRPDVVVLDPPRSGAGRKVVEALGRLAPRAVVYVACDPAALARDLATARAAGLELAALRVLDAFPMTHHVECLALLVPAADPTD
ncbi:class I SAM-dependent RNA methyltransferase [Ornithinimicrobium cerasi]|uniref:tRNA/tmRNA/rRNA uracil-C5-methylase, TrmA/RlmC/RlmD family n=1 Tax=Ornithinimicrobium cerasi TaxID=2248773 RepID=A0A285VE49_9MICO|nr:TRAM domain-containing protein [Ornithinimicrobium cerasi]SOC51356.1 tRNA/tmRNA/rRNA uracil-C5-methylase, TrmA/RlmC/RlmD family [Ornithinimicrobium cerasi]